MVKKRNGAAEATAATPVQTRESLQRISYLVQASVLLRSLVPLPPASTQTMPSKRKRELHEATGVAAEAPGGNTDAAAATSEPTLSTTIANKTTAHKGLQGQTGKQNKRKRARMSSKQALAPISDHLASQMSSVAKKATVRMDPALKRAVCRCCDAALIPGLSSTVRVKPSKAHAHMLVYTCLGCHAQRRIPATPHSQEEQPTTSTEAAPATSEGGSSSATLRLTKREKRERRQARPPVFFERDDHVVVRGSAVLSRNEYRQS
ncbi:hypothetical protein JCM10908_007284 [Rhodotorula pacifica]|uniref:ribonuclease P Rpr2/Rpp21/SNM1 subunit n=1 Tax=Rhodotorula pacifica TaxID=1495444 RepID=UPI00317A3A5F